MQFAYADWFETVFHWITVWDAQMNATQVTTKEWFEWANAQSLGMGEGSWGRSDHAWHGDIVYPSGHKVDKTLSDPVGTSWVSLQNGNVGHSPPDSPAWWALIDEPDIGADSALFTATAGTTKLSGWNQAQARKLSSHLFAQGPGVNTLVYSTPFDTVGHFVGKSDGLGQACVRMSLTTDTCYAFDSVADGLGGCTLNFYKVTAGSMALAHSAYVAFEPSGFDLRWYIIGAKLGVDYVTSPRRTLPAYIANDPLKWQQTYTTLAEWTDPNPIPLAGHEHVGYRVQDGSSLLQVTHEAFGGSMSVLSASAGPVSNGSATLSGTRPANATVTVT